MSDIKLQIDITKYQPIDRYPTVSSAFESLASGEKMELINDHDMRPLLQYKLSIDYPDQYNWEYVEPGSELWRVVLINLLQVKIVMADDEPGVLLLLCATLSKLEGALVVGTTENANNAIKIVREQNPDVAFLDIELPDMRGIELAEKLREIKQDIAIVFITAHQEYSLDAFKLYASDYNFKTN